MSILRINSRTWATWACTREWVGRCILRFFSSSHPTSHSHSQLFLWLRSGVNSLHTSILAHNTGASHHSIIFILYHLHGCIRMIYSFLIYLMAFSELFFCLITRFLTTSFISVILFQLQVEKQQQVFLFSATKKLRTKVLCKFLPRLPFSGIFCVVCSKHRASWLYHSWTSGWRNI